jgi:hypothetical protein
MHPPMQSACFDVSFSAPPAGPPLQAVLLACSAPLSCRPAHLSLTWVGQLADVVALTAAGSTTRLNLAADKQAHAQASRMDARQVSIQHVTITITPLRTGLTNRGGHTTQNRRYTAPSIMRNASMHCSTTAFNECLPTTLYTTPHHTTPHHTTPHLCSTQQ